MGMVDIHQRQCSSACLLTPPLARAAGQMLTEKEQRHLAEARERASKADALVEECEAGIGQAREKMKETQRKLNGAFVLFPIHLLLWTPRFYDDKTVTFSNISETQSMWTTSAIP
eukprot:SAG25_NODE_754_length_5543_cov_2.360764_2_plen_115_part_00